MQPYTQRWERPSKAYTTQVTAFLTPLMGRTPYRVSGLPYPNSTGLIQGIKTMGYSGGFMTKKMAYFRGVTNPDGGEPDDLANLHLNWYGVKFAYTHRPLDKPYSPGGPNSDVNCLSKWKATPIPHLYENMAVYKVPNDL